MKVQVTQPLKKQIFKGKAAVDEYVDGKDSFHVLE